VKKWLFIITLLLLQGCAILPWQVGVALNGADLLSATTTNKTLSEHALSAATDKDCQWYRLLDGEKACMNTAEEEAYLKEHKCIVPAWDVLKIPYCKKLLTRVEKPVTPGPDPWSHPLELLLQKTN